ncbi:hypothetical protein GW17_00056408, partial [Ensete ventricosum]
MHPLRFPNSGIRAKVFVRKIGFKLRVMRLNHVELFYAFLLHFRSEGSKEEGRPAIVSPHVGPATHGQAKAKAPQGGGRLRPGPTHKGQHLRARRAATVGNAAPARGLAAGHPQGNAA